MSYYKAPPKPLLWRLRSQERRFILLIGDFTMSTVALVTALWVWAQTDQWLSFSFQFLIERTPTWFYILPFVWIFLLSEIYDIRRASRRRDTVQGVGFAAAVSIGLYLILFFVSEPNALPRRGVAVFILVSSALTLLWRLFYIKIFTAPLFMRRVLIIGAGRAGSAFVKVIREMWPLPFFITGLIDDDPDKIGCEIFGYPVLGGSTQLLQIIQQSNISDLIFAISGEMKPEMLSVLLEATEQGIEVNTMPVVYEDLLGRVPILYLHSDWILRSFTDHAQVSGVYEFVKRLIDLLGGLIGCIFTILTFPLISLMIYFDSGGPVLYKQKRLGKNGEKHIIYKYRTMIKDAEKDGKAIPAVENDQRVTRVGRILRKSHLDEFPQFINVLRGEMSMVGPRAERLELVEELQTKVPFYRARLLVKPGMTGWAQVNFGYASTVEDTTIKLEYDLYYIKHRNILLDFSIIIRTVGAVIGFKGQ